MTMILYLLNLNYLILNSLGIEGDLYDWPTFLGKYLSCFEAFTLAPTWEIFVFFILFFSGVSNFLAFDASCGVIGFYILAVFVAIIGDYFSLSKIAQHNTSQAKSIAKNNIFITVFLLWRLFLPDFFVVGSMLALITKMQLSKKCIFALVFLAQGLRIILFALLVLLSKNPFFNL